MKELKQVNTFNKGINKDVAPEVYDNKHYTNARWLSPITNEENSLGVLVNPKGTREKFRIGVNEKIIGHCELRDLEIFITADTDGNTHIYKYQDDNSFNIQNKITGGYIPMEENNVFM